MRFGLLEDESDRTLEEIGKELNVTRERVRQIESSAIKKLIEINNWNYEDIYVAGDYYNDIEMNKDYQSFCFDFSPEELKKVSNYVVKDFSDILKKIGY